MSDGFFIRWIRSISQAIISFNTLACRVDEVRTDGELVGFFVDHPVGGGAADAFRTDDLGEFWSYFVEFIGGAEAKVRSVSDDPEASGPRHECAGAALALLVEHGEAWVNPGDRSRRWLGVGKKKEKRAGARERRLSWMREYLRKSDGGLMGVKKMLFDLFSQFARTVLSGGAPNMAFRSPHPPPIRSRVPLVNPCWSQTCPFRRQAAGAC